MKDEDVRKSVREGYAKIAQQDSTCCEPTNSCCDQPSSCCDSSTSARDISKSIGYTDEELEIIPEEANLGLGCGNPTALASLKEGETVLDLGSGAGMDCFLAASKVGKTGRVIGIDMTPEMIDKARENARKGDYTNVEFRLGEIENLPAADNSVDAIISNCVINLAADKKRVFQEAFRVLKPGGRLMISDIVLMKELPEIIKNSVQAYVGCIAGAMIKSEYLAAIDSAGFQDVSIVDETTFPIDCLANDPTAQAIMENLSLTPDKAIELATSILSIKVSGIKPG